MKVRYLIDQITPRQKIVKSHQNTKGAVKKIRVKNRGRFFFRKITQNVEVGEKVRGVSKNITPRQIGSRLIGSLWETDNINLMMTVSKFPTH